MAVNRTKVLEAAQKFLSKGQYDKAIAEYQKLVAEDPRDVRTLLKIGDLHTKRSKPKDAIEVYLKVAELYAKQGFFLKAVAVYKQILKLDPTHIESSQKLAKMYEELALTSDALNTYEHVADAYLSQGQTDKALETMARMVELDGQNVAVRIKYAEALSKAEKTKEAARAFAEGAQLLKEQGRMDDYIRVVERQLYHDAENLDLARTLSNLYLERQDPKRALAKLQICFKADPRDLQTLEMLAEAFRQLGQMPKTISVLKEIARLQAEFGSTEARRRTLQRVLDLDPNDVETRQGLGGAPAQAQPTGPAAHQPLRMTHVGTMGDRIDAAAAQPLRGTQVDRMAQPAVPASGGSQGERTATAPANLPRAAQGERMPQPRDEPMRSAQADRVSPAPAEPLRATRAVAPVQAKPVAAAARAASSFPPVPELDIPDMSIDGGGDFDAVKGRGGGDEDLLTDEGEIDDVLIVDDRMGPEEAMSHMPPAAAAPVARQQENQQDAIARLLADAHAHEGYRLYDKEETLLKEVLSLDPDHVATHERLKDLYIRTDRRVEAARELLWLSDVWALRDLDRAIRFAREAHALAPHAAATKKQLAALGVPVGPDAPGDVLFVDDSLPNSMLDRQTQQHEPRSAVAESPATKQVELPLLLSSDDPLDSPISPDEFDAAPPSRAHRLENTQYADWLEVDVSPEDFDRAEPAVALPASAAQDAVDGEMGDPLDAPISPDEFDAPPPRRSGVGPSDIGDLLNMPQPADDFGLSDERYDRSGLMDTEATEVGDAVEIRAAAAESAARHAAEPVIGSAPVERADYDEPSVEFVDVATGELDITEIEAVEAENEAYRVFAAPLASQTKLARDEFDAETSEVRPQQPTKAPAAEHAVTTEARPPLPTKASPAKPAAVSDPHPQLLTKASPAKPAMTSEVRPELSTKTSTAKPAVASEVRLPQSNKVLPVPKAGASEAGPPQPNKPPVAQPTAPSAVRLPQLTNTPRAQPKPAASELPSTPRTAPIATGAGSGPEKRPLPAFSAGQAGPAQPVVAPLHFAAKAPLAPTATAVDAAVLKPGKTAGSSFTGLSADSDSLSNDLNTRPVAAAPAALATTALDIDDMPEIEETLDEADFFASQGMMDEAMELIQEAILIYPGSKVLRVRLSAYESAAARQQAQADGDTKLSEDESFVIAEQLAEQPGARTAAAPAEEMVDVESVFAQFKRGVSEQIGLDDSETHFDLGIAYKEMGLTTDAMQEFEIASRGAKRACAALTMIGTCALEQGDPQRAVDQFNRALATEHKAAGEELALQYEIGNAYELLGQFDRAIRAFEQAAARDRSFRGVAQRLEQLKRQCGTALNDDAEVDAALDELLGGE